MPTLTEALHGGTFIVSEGEGWFSRDPVTVALSQTLVAGNPVYKSGVIANETSSVAADAGNTGNGVFTLDATTPVLAAGQNGQYRVVCIAVATNSGTFAVFDPQGVEIGRVAVAATFNNQIKFVIADGATDFVAGDAFTVSVGRESNVDETVTALPNDGSQVCAGLMVYPVTTDGSTTKKGSLLCRRAEYRAADITWPGSISAANKAKAIEELRAIGLIGR
jgi:hypothetical protein